MLRGGGSLDKVTRGLQLLNEWKTRLGADRPELIFSSTCMRQNIADLPGLARYAAAHQVRIISVPLVAAEALEGARRVAEERGVTLWIHPALKNLWSAQQREPGVGWLLADEPALDTRGKSLLE